MAGEAVRVRGGKDTQGKGRQTGEGRRKWGVQRNVKQNESALCLEKTQVGS